MSSLKDIDWLSAGDESSHPEVVVHSSSSDGKKNSNTNSDMLSKELSSTGTKRTELEVDGEHARSVSTTATDLGSKLMPFSYEEREVGHVAQGLPIRSTEQTSAEHALRASHPKDDLTSQDAAETPQNVLKIKESVTGAKSQGEQKEIPVAIIADIHPVAGIKSSTSVDNSVDKTLDNKVHHELLVACRAHRASVLRSTMSAGTGSLPPSVVQQLSLSACQLLIRIGDLKSALPESSIVASSQNDRSQHTPSQGLSQSLSQQDDITDEMQMYSIDTLLLQAAALLALCLHRAPDDILAAVSDQLLTRISSESKQSQWQNKEQIQPITAIIFLSGVLLTRIRSLSAPASRLLLRALEVGVKKTPDDMLSFILPLIAGATATLQPASQHHELLQRVARQVLSGVQCDELVYHLCFQGSLGSCDSLTAIQAAGRVFDVLLPAAVTGLPQVAPKIAGGRVERGTKSSSSSTNVAIGLKQMKRTDGRLSGAGMELTVAEQDLWSVRWAAIVNSLLQLPDGDDSRKRWNLLELGRKLKQEGIRVDVELSKVVNSILTMVSSDLYGACDHLGKK